MERGRKCMADTRKRKEGYRKQKICVYQNDKFKVTEHLVNKKRR